MSGRHLVRRPRAGAAVLASLAFVLVAPAAAAQAVPTWPGDSVTPRARPDAPVYASSGPIAPTLPGDTLLGNALSADAAVPLYPIAPTMPGDVITRPPLWVLDTLRADSVRQGLIEPDSLAPPDTLAPPDAATPPDSSDRPGFRVLPDQRERADSLRPAPRRDELRRS